MAKTLWTIDDMAALFPHNRVYYSDGAGRVGFRMGGGIAWFVLHQKHGWRMTGTTRTPGAGASKHQIWKGKTPPHPTTTPHAQP